MVKKLKKIPYDLVSYITIETEAIKDANDKQMISSYCLSYLQKVNQYIEILRAKDERYIVPHSLSELESIRSQLQSCHAQIMRVKVTNPNNRPLVDVKYPKGYEG